MAAPALPPRQWGLLPRAAGPSRARTGRRGWNLVTLLRLLRRTKRLGEDLQRISQERAPPRVALPLVPHLRHLVVDRELALAEGDEQHVDGLLGARPALELEQVPVQRLV